MQGKYGLEATHPRYPHVVQKFRRGGSKVRGPGRSSLTRDLTRPIFPISFKHLSFFEKVMLTEDSARPQRKHAKPWQGRLRRGGGPVREPMTGQHAHMQAKRTAAAQGVLKFASSTQRTNPKKVWLGSNAPTIPADTPMARRSGSKVAGQDGVTYLNKPNKLMQAGSSTGRYKQSPTSSCQARCSAGVFTTPISE